MNDILQTDMKILVALITSEIRSREDKKAKWSQFKKDNREKLRVILGLPEREDVNPGTLMGFDIDDENNHGGICRYFGRRKYRCPRKTQACQPSPANM